MWEKFARGPVARVDAGSPVDEALGGGAGWGVRAAWREWMKVGCPL